MQLFRFLKSLVFFIILILLLSLAANQPVKQTEVAPMKLDLLANPDAVDRVMTITTNLDSLRAKSYSLGYRLRQANDTMSIQKIQLLWFLPQSFIQQEMLMSFEQGVLAGQADSRKKLGSKNNGRSP